MGSPTWLTRPVGRYSLRSTSWGYERPESVHQTSRGLMGLIVPELSNPIFPLFAQQIEQLLAPSGHTPLLCTQTPGGISEDEYIEMLVDRGVAGIIFVSGRHADTTGDVTRYQRLRERGVPLVTINGNAPTIKAPGFATDDRRATRIAVDHLIALGHQRIGLAMGPMRMVPAQRKRSGYEDAMGEGLPEEPLRIVETLYTYEGGVSAALHLLEQGCTGIVCSSDVMALGVVHGVRQTGRSVPHDVSVIGYDDSPLIPMTDPPLTRCVSPWSPSAGRPYPRSSRSSTGSGRPTPRCSSPLTSSCATRPPRPPSTEPRLAGSGVLTPVLRSARPRAGQPGTEVRQSSLQSVGVSRFPGLGGVSLLQAVGVSDTSCGQLSATDGTAPAHQDARLCL